MSAFRKEIAFSHIRLFVGAVVVYKQIKFEKSRK